MKQPPTQSTDNTGITDVLSTLATALQTLDDVITEAEQTQA
jgi:hypothetical protein